ncbi:MAG TPA: MotA/TolQ/ExbB proton channel family protein [Acidobacteriota bacterium]|nr:MotA/TolQ/ExbB proton channel family protein [Acidobacteriota bacterium]
MDIIIPTVITLDVSSTVPAGSSFWTLLAQASEFAFAILIILILFSLMSWTLIFQKWKTFKNVRHESREFIALFRKSPRLSEVDASCVHYRQTPLSGVFSAGYQELNAQIQSLKPQQSSHFVLESRHIAGIQRALQRASAAELSVLEKNMTWLATTASVTPFIGLLGTVVGIIHSFIGLGLEKAASIQAVAPGIAEALIATAAGLFAAIPAVIAYNNFLGKIKVAATEMDDFSIEFVNLVERSFS